MGAVHVVRRVADDHHVVRCGRPAPDLCGPGHGHRRQIPACRPVAAPGPDREPVQVEAGRLDLEPPALGIVAGEDTQRESVIGPKRVNQRCSTGQHAYRRLVDQTPGQVPEIGLAEPIMVRLGIVDTVGPSGLGPDQRIDPTRHVDAVEAELLAIQLASRIVHRSCARTLAVEQRSVYVKENQHRGRL